jgi:hypothetical protein
MYSRSHNLFIVLAIVSAFALSACEVFEDVQDSVEDSINDAAEQRQNVEMRMDPLPVGVPKEFLAYIPEDILADYEENGLPADIDVLLEMFDVYIQMAADEFGQEYVDMIIGALHGKFCLPTAQSIDDYMVDESWWADAKSHLEEIEISEINYKVRSNASTAHIHFNFYLTDSADWEQISSDERLGGTDWISAGENVDWTPLDVEGDAYARMESLMLNPSTDFSVCVTIPEIEEGTADLLKISQEVQIELSGIVTFVPL